MGRPREHGEETKQSLLSAACELLAKSGPEAVSLRALVGSVGLTTRTVYSVFGSKEGLVRAMYQHGFQELDRELTAVDSTDPIERVVELGLAYRRSALASPELYRVMFLQPFPQFERNEDDRDLARQTLQRLRSTVVEAHSTGAIEQSQDPEVTTLHLWGVMHGFALLELNNEFDHIEPGEDHWRTAIRAYLRSIQTPLRAL